MSVFDLQTSGHLHIAVNWPLSLPTEKLKDHPLAASSAQGFSFSVFFWGFTLNYLVDLFGSFLPHGAARASTLFPSLLAGHLRAAKMQPVKLGFPQPSWTWQVMVTSAKPKVPGTVQLGGSELSSSFYVYRAIYKLLLKLK